jgi:pimeloyl-ACP methyl ester carboxylesterase
MKIKGVFLAVILGAVLCISGNIFAYSGGNGSAGNPYKITNVANFQQLSATPTDWNKFFILTANINLTGLTFTQAPIAPGQGTPFTGVFDGNGHTIFNLSIGGYPHSYVGLFGYIGTGGQVRNMGLENVSVDGSDYVGELVGKNGGTLTSCYATGSVIGDFNIGGLVGYNEYGSITDCYATGTVGGYDSVGGLVGWNNDSLTSCFWDIQTSGQTVGVGFGTSTGVTGKTTVQMKTLSTFTSAGWDFVDTWRMPNGSYPRLILHGAFPATNNWDGTVTVTWPEKGRVQLIRQESGNPSNWIGWSRTGTTYKDTYQPSEFKKKYIYIVKDLSGTELGRSGEVMPDIVVVLVRGYSPSEPVDNNYWISKSSEQSKGLEADVRQWFIDKGVTCWLPPQGFLDGQGLSGWKTIEENSKELKTFIDSQNTSDYTNAKINLIGHSMGGLISRRYVQDYGGVNNVICVQTPHTGSPLAGLKDYWDLAKTTVNILNVRHVIFNNANSNLKSNFTTEFNKTYSSLNNAKLYLIYSNNYTSVLNDIGLKSANWAIRGFSEYTQFDEQKSDGAVPYVSGYGMIYKKVGYGNPNYGTYVELWQPDYQVGLSSVRDNYENGYDHLSGYRHKDTLNKIMEWLGYPQAIQMMSIAGKSQTSSGGESETETPIYFIAGFSGEFENSQPVSKTVTISNTQKAYFRVISSDPNCSFTLRKPDSSIIDPVVAGSDPNITYYSEDGVMAYEIQEPMPGLWTMNLTTTVTAPNCVQYGLTAFEDQKILFSADSGSEWINTGQSVLLKAALSDNAGAITGATVSGVVSLPNTTTQNIILYDDGTNGDPNANDGTYSYLFSSTSLEGRYNVDVNATGIISGSNFERTATTSFTVSISNVVVNGATTDQGIDTNGNGKFDLLRFTVPVNVLAAKEYRLTASLTDSQGELISLINSGLMPLSVDANSITVEVDAKTIVKHNVNGPYALKNIQISDGNTGLVIASAIDHNTAAYQIAQFEPLDSDGDGLSDVMELSIGTDPNKVDTDEDGATDYQEISVDGNSTSYNPLTDSNPLVQDTDGDDMPDGYEISYGLNPLIDDTTEDLDGDGLTNIQEYNLHTRPDKIDTDDDGRNDRWEIENSTNPLVYENYTRIAGDINLDAAVDIYDLGIMASQWLSMPGVPSADIAPPPYGEGIVNLFDFAVLAENWSPCLGQNLGIGLTAHWLLDENTGSSATDTVAGRIAMLINNLSWGFAWADEDWVHLSNQTQTITIPTSVLQPQVGTIAVWVAPDSLSGIQFILGHVFNNSNRINLYSVAGKLALGLGTNAALQTNIADLNVGQRVHIALTWNGTSYAVYVNAVQKAADTFEGLTALNTTMDIGNYGDPANRTLGFAGIIEDIRTYNRALQATEIQNLYYTKDVRQRKSAVFAVQGYSPVTTTLPAGAKFESGIFSWQPWYDQTGDYQIRFTAAGQPDRIMTVSVHDIPLADWYRQFLVYMGKLPLGQTFIVQPTNGKINIDIMNSSGSRLEASEMNAVNLFDSGGMAFLSAQTIEANQYVIWGIGDDEIAIPAGSVITEAVLTITNVAPQNTPLYIHLLDNTEKGLQIGTDDGTGDSFISYGVLLSGTYENGNYVCRFSQNDLLSPIRTIFPSPTSVTLADASTVQLSSAFLELMDYVGNGRGFGIGIDNGNNTSYSIDTLKLELTIRSYTTQTSQTLVFTY